jgi:hypothetical protein
VDTEDGLQDENQLTALAILRGQARVQCGVGESLDGKRTPHFRT